MTPSQGRPRRVRRLCVSRYAQYWADARALDQFARHSIHPVPSCADIKFTLTPSQSPGPTRSLSDLRVDPRIPNDGRPVGIGKTLLPFDGEGLFSLEEVYFPLYNNKSAKTRWRPGELAICSYHGARVRHSVATRPDYRSAYLASLIDEEWDIDAQD